MPPRKNTTKTPAKATTAKATPKKETAPVEETLEEALTIESAEAVATSSDETIDFEQAEIETLRAQLAEAQQQLAAAKANERPAPDSELTPEQREIRNLQDQLARTNGQRVDTVEEIFEGSEDGILIHILEDGFTFAGRVWYRGQEIEIGPKAFEESKNRFGVSFLSMDDAEQYKAYGKVLFRKGPWPGSRQYENGEEIKRTTAPVIQL